MTGREALHNRSQTLPVLFFMQESCISIAKNSKRGYYKLIVNLFGTLKRKVGVQCKCAALQEWCGELAQHWYR